MNRWFRWENDTLLLWVRVQPKASRDGFAEIFDDTIKLRITAPPVDGKANQHLIAWLAKAFAVPKSAISIEQGQTSRRKSLRIDAPGRIPAELIDKIAIPD